METTLGHMVDFVIDTPIRTTQHGLNWVIQMKDDYSGYIITNNAGDWYPVSDLPEALEFVKHFD